MLPHPPREAGVGNLTQLFHSNNSFLPEIHIVLYLPGPTSDPALGPPRSLTGPGVHRESDLKGFKPGTSVVVLRRSCRRYPSLS